MMNLEYQLMRTFADSWGLLFMVLIFVIAVFRALRPSARQRHDEAANIPFKED
jgi:cytochrome c oxidase cbb3-type subunit IV